MENVDVYFKNIREEIINRLNDSKKSIKICMAWLTDPDLMTVILERLDVGVEIEICLLDDPFNRKGHQKTYHSKLDQLKNYWADLSTFQKKGGKLNIIPNTQSYIHNKFAVIDERVTITGSYNWSKKAVTNRENIVVINCHEIAQEYLEEFDEIVFQNLEDIIDKNFPSCSHSGCNGKILKIRVIDSSNITEYQQAENYIFNFCTSDIEHLELFSQQPETDILYEIYENESNSLDNAETQTDILNRSVVYKRNTDSVIAWSVNSRVDVFIDQNSHNALGLFKVTQDMDGDFDLDVVWEHDLIKHYHIVGFSNEMLDIIEGF